MNNKYNQSIALIIESFTRQWPAMADFLRSIIKALNDPRYYWCGVSLNVGATIANVPWLYNCTKPLLMPLLAAHCLSHPIESQHKKTIIMLLFFAWLGDVSLQWVSIFPLAFLFGLGAFLVAQLLYATSFWQISRQGTGWLQRRPLLTLPFLLYAIGLMTLLWPSLPTDMRLPVVVYASAVAMMGMSAYNLKGIVPDALWALIFGGACLFLISDSLIAIDRFLHPIPKADAWIMATYCLAQWGLIMGYRHAVAVSVPSPTNKT